MAGDTFGRSEYELDVDLGPLKQGLASADQEIRKAGASAEKAFGGQATAGLDRTTAAAGRFGGVLDGVSAKGTRFGGMMTHLGGGILQGVGIAGFLGVAGAAGAMASAIVDGVGKSIDAASNLAETQSKVGVVFGQQTDAVRAWAKGSAEAMGLSQNAALGAAATYGNLLTALKLPGPQAAEMSTSLVKLAGDLASFNNVPVDEALAALQSGLTGETEPLRRFGVNLNDATLKQQALAMGLISSTKDALTPATKAQATYALILDQTKTAQGDFARTSSGLANQQRISAARMEDAMGKLGGALLPIATTIVPLLANALTGLVEGVGNVIKAGSDWLGQNKWLTDAIGFLAGVIGTVLGAAIGKLGEILGGVAKMIGDVFGVVLTVVKTVVGAVLTAVQSIMQIASQIPGPWQEAATNTAAALDKMKGDVAAWGTSTTGTAAATGEAIPGAVADPIAAGASTVGAAATTGITDPIAAAAAAGKTDATAAAKATPESIAKSLLEGQFSVKDAAENLKEVQKTALGKAKEIAKIEGFLTGDALKDALNDKRPAVRAAAEAWKAAAEDRLLALKTGVPETARKTGQNYADALAAKKAAVEAAAKAATKPVTTVTGSIADRMHTAGAKAGQQYADGIRSKAREVLKAAGYLAYQVEKILKLESPAKEGPLSKLGGPEGWGAILTRQYASAMLSELEYFRHGVLTLASTASSALVPGATTVLAPGATVATPTVPIAAAGLPQHPITINGGITIAFTEAVDFGRQTPRSVANELAQEMRLVLARTVA